MKSHEQIISFIANSEDGVENAAKRITIELLCDIRELLQKLVEKKERTKVISTEVPMSDKEKALLDNIETIHA